MNGWLYLLAAAALAAPIIGMVLRRRLLRSHLGPGHSHDAAPHDPTKPRPPHP